MSKTQPYHPVGFATFLLDRQGINRLRFQEAEVLLGEGVRLIDETGRESISGSKMLLVAQATRAAHTFETIVAAAKMGRGVQASMLNRALLEDVLDIHWVAANPELAPDRASEHNRFMDLAEHELESRFGRTERTLTVDEQAELKTLIDAYGGPRRAYRAPWTRASADERLRLVKERWSDEPEAAGLLEYIFKAIQRRNNVLLHGSPTAYRQTITERPGGRRMLNRAGPDAQWREALNQSAGAYMLCLRVLADEFDLDRRRFGEVFNRLTCLCKSIDSLRDLDDIAPDAPCPCDSGWPVAECHRS